MQTIVVPWSASDNDRKLIEVWRPHHSKAVRTAYANAPRHTEQQLRELLKARFPDTPLGSWAMHCATREGLRLRAQVPEGHLVFGGRANLERRRKGLISSNEWKALRQRPIEIIGDRTRWGNRHFRLAPDGLSCRVEFLKQSATLRLPGCRAKPASWCAPWRRWLPPAR